MVGGGGDWGGVVGVVGGGEIDGCGFGVESGVSVEVEEEDKVGGGEELVE